MATTDYGLENSLPASIDAERSILGAILLDNFLINQAAELINAEDFSLDSHRRIYGRMLDLNETARPIDLIALCDELGRHKELEAIGGVAYLSSLTEGLSRRSNIEHWVKIVRDKALLRGLIHAASSAIAHASEQADPADVILDAAESAIFKLSENRIGRGFLDIKEIVKEIVRFPGRAVRARSAYYGAGNAFRGSGQHDQRVAAIGPGDRGCPALDGKNRFCDEYRGERRGARQEGRGHVLAGNVTRGVAAPPFVFSRPCGLAPDAHRFSRRDDYNKLVEALGALSEAPIYIDDTPGISLHEMRAKARRLQQSQGRLDLIIVDYLQLMSASAAGMGSRRFENRTQEVSAISRGLKALAKELRVPLIALSQLSRAPESRGGDHRPQLSDLRESGSIEQDADVVAFIFREEVYKPDDPDLDGLAELIIAKQRNGPTGRVDLAFIKRSTRFESRANDGNNESY